MRDDFTRSAIVVRVIDGDTFLCRVDLGFHIYAQLSCRLAGINTNEHDEPGGPEARDALTKLLPEGLKVTVNSVRADKYAGRFDAVVVSNSTLINDWMVQHGYAVPWDGTGPRPSAPWPPAE